LVRDSFDGASTNRIAAEAGVSIGSLYQYFPSKEALVAAVIERHKQELMKVARGTLAKVAKLPLEEAVRRFVEMAIKAHRVNPKLHRVLAEQIPRTGKQKDIETFDRENYALFRAYLVDHRDEIRSLDLEVAAFVCVTSIEALTHAAILHRLDIPPDQLLPTLVDEGTRLVVQYLR